MVEGLTSSATDQGSVAGSNGIHARVARNEMHSCEIEASIEYRTNIVQVADFPGDSSGEATPVPIPNTEVKLSSAEDTERAAFREHRSSPGFLRFQGVVATVEQARLRQQAHDGGSTAEVRPDVAIRRTTANLTPKSVASQLRKPGFVRDPHSDRRRSASRCPEPTDTASHSDIRPRFRGGRRSIA